MIKKVVPAIVVLGLLGGAGWYIWHQQQAKFYYTGTIEATDVDVPARLATVLRDLAVDEGDQVKAGQVLAKLDCDDVTVEAGLARTSYERAAHLVKSGTVTREMYDQVKAKKDEADLKLSWCSVVAPITGTVLTRYHEKGEWVAPGIKLMTLADLSSVWAYVYVPEPMLGKLKVGDPVPGLIPELGGKGVQGTIVKINERSEFTPRNVQTREERTRLVFGVKVRFANAEGVLKPGMPIEVDLPDAGHG